MGNSINIHDGVIAYDNSRYGIYISPNASGVYIHDDTSVYSNVVGDIVDQGNNNRNEAQVRVDTQAGAIWDKQVSEHVAQGSFGQLIGKKLLTLASYIGLK